MPVGVGEVAGVAAPEGVLRRFDDRGAGGDGLLYEGVHFVARGDVVGEGEFGAAARARRNGGVAGEAGTREQGKFQPRLHVEERNGAMLELLADDAGRGEAEAVAVEGDGSFEVVDAEGDESNARFHGELRKRVGLVLRGRHWRVASAEVQKLHAPPTDSQAA